MAKKDTVVLAWGRFNPPTTGHEKLILRVEKEARSRNADYLIYPTKTTDRKKNPLSFKEKVRFMKRMFPKHSSNISSKNSINTLIKAAQQSEKDGYSNLVVVVGADRVAEFKSLLNKYNRKDYNFDKIEIVSAGERDPDAEGIVGMSASKMRAAAASGDFKSFSSGLPSKFRGGKDLYNAVRSGMGVNEEMVLTEQSKRLQFGGVGGPRFNKLLRFGLTVEGQADIPLTKRAFGNFRKAQSDPKMRAKVFETTDLLFDFVLEDDIIYQRLVMLLHKRQIFGDKKMKNEHKIVTSLWNKSRESGIEYDILAEVFNRGLGSWNDGDCPSGSLSAAQWSFSRVNSFISGGNSRKTSDNDLWEEHVQKQPTIDEVFEMEFEAMDPKTVADRNRAYAEKTQNIRQTAQKRIRDIRKKAQDAEVSLRDKRSIA